ncbi:MAG: beta-lactamase family protein [Bacteroidetes bacterium]|nr:beta-lactamase family protein [Fibrella sp.]
MNSYVNSNTLTAELQKIVDQGVPGISAAIATSQGVIWTGVAGCSNVVTRQPLHEANLLGIGSITKTFVAVVILQLVEEGKLSLNHTAQDVLGGMVQYIPNANQATLAQLMNHTGGVPSWEDDSLWIRQGRGRDLDPQRHWGKLETLAYVRGHAALNAPGHQFNYANTNYTLLGLAIEKVTGQDVAHEIRTRICQPLGLAETFLEGFELEPRRRLARRYHFATAEFCRTAGVAAGFPEVQPGLVDVSSSNLSVEWTAGGVVTTARDLATFALALRTGPLLKAASRTFMQTWESAGAQWQVGHGLFRDQRFGPQVLVGHDGGVLGFTASFFWVEGTDAVIVLLANVGVMHAGKVPVNLLRAAKGSAFTELALQFAAQSNTP